MIGHPQIGAGHRVRNAKGPGSHSVAKVGSVPGQRSGKAWKVLTSELLNLL
jgi:hypothetical protein